MTENAKAMVLASFAADSLALGPHWIYDTDVIQQKFGRPEDLLQPEPGSFHAGKQRGAFTHYGDQTLVLLQSVAARGGFDPADFAERWQASFADYAGYVDNATRAALSNLAAGQGPESSGSLSHDLGGASRIAPLVYVYRDDLPALVAAARAQTRMTHDNREVLDGAAFFAEVAWTVLRGSSPVEAMERVGKERFADSPLSEWVDEGVESAGKDSVRAVFNFGQSCDVAGAFPAVVHLISRSTEDLREALIQNVIAGGDSAARGMLVGLVLGAYAGIDAIPGDWLSGMQKRDEILALLEK